MKPSPLRFLSWFSHRHSSQVFFPYPKSSDCATFHLSPHRQTLTLNSVCIFRRGGEVVFGKARFTHRQPLHERRWNPPPPILKQRSKQFGELQSIYSHDAHIAGFAGTWSVRDRYLDGTWSVSVWKCEMVIALCRCMGGEVSVTGEVYELRRWCLCFGDGMILLQLKG